MSGSSPRRVPLDRVLLIGMMGAGKTTIGRALATRLGWTYWDNDELLRRAVGKDTRRVQQEDGVLALRRAESAALDVALTLGGPLVAGVAGGVVMDPLDLQRLRDGGFVVWLRADIDALVRRVTGTDRPWLGDDPKLAMQHLYAGREALYSAAASMVLDEEDITPDLAAARIAHELLSRL